MLTQSRSPCSLLWALPHAQYGIGPSVPEAIDEGRVVSEGRSSAPSHPLGLYVSLRVRNFPLLGTGVAASGHDERDVPRISDVGNEEHEY